MHQSRFRSAVYTPGVAASVVAAMAAAKPHSGREVVVVFHDMAWVGSGRVGGREEVNIYQRRRHDYL